MGTRQEELDVKIDHDHDMVTDSRIALFPYSLCSAAAMAGETDLDTLLRSMQPELQPGEFVFCTLPDEARDLRLAWQMCAEFEPIGQFREAEGLTVIVARSQADEAQLHYTSIFSMITLTVHSSLDAVGFLARITAELAAHQISVNAISAYYHDHLFVPRDRAQNALEILQAIAGQASA